MNEIFEDIERWRAVDQRVAIARVVDIEGSGPRDPGARRRPGPGSTRPRPRVRASPRDPCPPRIASSAWPYPGRDASAHLRAPSSTSLGLLRSLERQKFRRRCLGQANLGQGMAVEMRRIFMGDHADLVGRKIPEHVLHDLLGIGPGPVAVGIVGLEENIFDPDSVTGGDGGRIVNHAEPEITTQGLARRAILGGPTLAIARARHQVVQAIGQHGDPTDSAL